jgi:hypothetical protein
MVRLAVIEQYLLARFDVPQSEKQDVAVDDFAVAVRLAGVIDELRAVAAAAAVYRPVRVNATDVEASFIFHPALDFVAGNSFAGVLGDLAPPFESDRCETAFAINPGPSDFDAGSEPGFLVGLSAALSHSASAQSTGNVR